MAYNHHGVLLLVRYDPQRDDVEGIEVFDSSRVSSAEIYEQGLLIDIIKGDGAKVAAHAARRHHHAAQPSS